MGQIIYREYVVFRGSNISCSLASLKTTRFQTSLKTQQRQPFSQVLTPPLSHPDLIVGQEALLPGVGTGSPTP